VHGGEFEDLEGGVFLRNGPDFGSAASNGTDFAKSLTHQFKFLVHPIDKRIGKQYLINRLTCHA